MSEYWRLIVLFISCWILQLGFSYFQYQSYQKLINSYKQQMFGYLGVGIAKKKFTIGSDVILVVVIDERNTIVNFHEMTGFTVFARFKEKQEFIGKKTTEILEKITHPRKKQAFEQALSLIDHEKRKQEVS